jgi:hypothetical protein
MIDCDIVVGLVIGWSLGLVVLVSLLWKKRRV